MSRSGLRAVPFTVRDTLHNHKVSRDLGMVYGNTVRTRNVFADMWASVRAVVGGEIGGYSRLLQDARREATQRMQLEAAELGADAVVRVRYQTATVMANSAEVLCYGSAVKLEKKNENEKDNENDDDDDEPHTKESPPRRL